VSQIPVDKLKVERVALSDGKTGWRVKIPGGRALATPAVVDGIAYVGGGFGSNEFYAFDAETGRPRWGIRVSDDGPTAAVVAQGRVVFNTESCTLFVVDAKTGKHLWSRWLGDPLMSQPAIANGVVYMAYPGSDGRHRLIALGLQDGRQKFEVAIAGDIISAPVVDGDSIYLATFDGTVYRHRTSDGKQLWSKKMGATSAPTIAGGEIQVAQGEPIAAGGGAGKREGFRTLSLAGREQGGLKAPQRSIYLEPQAQARTSYAKDQADADGSVGFGGGAPSGAKTKQAAENLGQGTVRGLWEFQGSRPTVIGRDNYLTQGDSLRALDVATGKVKWENKLSGDIRKIGGHLASPPAYAAGKLVIGTVSGDIAGYDAQTGKRLFDYPVKEQIRFQPALVKGRIFVGTAQGTLVSIQSGDPTLDGWSMWGGGPRHNGPEKN
jgi:Ca-activated chloride channel family protein